MLDLYWKKIKRRKGGWIYQGFPQRQATVNVFLNVLGLIRAFSYLYIRAESGSPKKKRGGEGRVERVV